MPLSVPVNELRRWAMDHPAVQAHAELALLALRSLELNPDAPFFRQLAKRRLDELESALRSPVMAGEPSNINGAVSQSVGEKQQGAV